MVFNLGMCPQCIWRKIDINEKSRERSRNCCQRDTDRKLDRSLHCCFGLHGWPFVPAKGNESLCLKNQMELCIKSG